MSGLRMQKSLLITNRLWGITGCSAITSLKSVRNYLKTQDGVGNPYIVTGLAAFPQELQVYFQLSEGDLFIYLLPKKVVSLIHLPLEEYCRCTAWRMRWEEI